MLFIEEIGRVGLVAAGNQLGKNLGQLPRSNNAAAFGMANAILRDASSSGQQIN